MSGKGIGFQSKNQRFSLKSFKIGLLAAHARSAGQSYYEATAKELRSETAGRAALARNEAERSEQAAARHADEA